MNCADAYQTLWQQLLHEHSPDVVSSLTHATEHALEHNRNGNLAGWQSVLADLPVPSTRKVALFNQLLTFGEASPQPVPDGLDASLRKLHPWRKGPVGVNGVPIDTEWRSDWKWDRVCDSITPLKGRRVLDVGCGNGYHCWRMYLDGARLVVGIDPTLLFVMQFFACKHFVESAPVWVLPLALEQTPENGFEFDTVFSMGVLYHRRSPIDHLYSLKQKLSPGGELILETLIVDGADGYALVPPDRYAQMRNVWFLPSVETLQGWIKRCGFVDVRLIDITQTSTEEQRSTDWMQFQSLSDFLDPEDRNKTVEGHPAPKRATIVARQPS